MNNKPDPSIAGLTELAAETVGHKESIDDDCGLPEDPVFSNYVKYQWKSHSENRRIPRNARGVSSRDPKV